jgi:hypothetical protein
MATSAFEVIGNYRQDWIDGLLATPASFQKGMLQLGLNQNAITTDLEAYRRAEEILALPAVPRGIQFYSPDDYERMANDIFRRRHASYLNSVRDLIARRDYVIEDFETHQIRVPLFRSDLP